jgi:hypothetical protein
MATNATQQHTDNCHYPYANGYQTLADRIYPIVAHDMYSKPITPTNYPPKPEYVYQTNYNQITLTLNTSNLVCTPGAQNDFRIENSPLTVTSGIINNNTLTLTFSGALPNGAALSYKGHTYTSTPFVTNTIGVGLLSFYNMPVLTAALSADFLGLSANQQKEQNHLYWRTATNAATDYFAVEKSNNTTDWQTIGKTYTLPNASIYEYVDANPNEGNNYYRIKIVYNDEKTNYSPIISLKNASKNASVRLYPNPANEYLCVELPIQYQGSTQLHIQNMMGTVVHTQNFESQNGGTAQIDTHNLPQGLYQIIIKNEDALPRCLKFLVE